MNNTPIYYFSYGMNTSPYIMNRLDYCKPIGTAVLKGYHLSFRIHANLEEGGTVTGALWEIDSAALKRLDVQEGYPSYYDRKEVEVDFNGTKYTAITYIMADTKIPIHGKALPDPEYLKHIIEGYDAFEIPFAQLKEAIHQAFVAERSSLIKPAVSAKKRIHEEQ